ncbi:sortase A [Alkalibacterium subtropicum]|uniref:Sortase A n=1 Tax=Alkalibacterium subtropicum TaxID=753702 RepID=A0A1I1LN15_9LACT|nr:class D sortase [Alkalibacterium subtropicum]SFC74375.1 sortase A [Alkalibacterium subtropicum]
MKALANVFIIVGLAFLGWFGYSLYEQDQMQSVTIEEAETAIEVLRTESSETDSPDREEEILNFSPEMYEAFGILHIPKLDRSIGVVEGTDPDALDKGVGHMSSTVLPGQGDQIVFSGHRDTVFKNFAELELGDTFVVEMPYGDYIYEIKDTEVVDEDDTSVVGKMGEEVLVVSTCYPFDYLGSAPERFVFYAYPVVE